MAAGVEMRTMICVIGETVTVLTIPDFLECQGSSTDPVLVRLMSEIASVESCQGLERATTGA